MRLKHVFLWYYWYLPVYDFIKLLEFRIQKWIVRLDRSVQSCCNSLHFFYWILRWLKRLFTLWNIANPFFPFIIFQYFFNLKVNTVIFFSNTSNTLFTINLLYNLIANLSSRANVFSVERLCTWLTNHFLFDPFSDLIL